MEILASALSFSISVIVEVIVPFHHPFPGVQFAINLPSSQSKATRIPSHPLQSHSLRSFLLESSILALHGHSKLIKRRLKAGLLFKLK